MISLSVISVFGNLLSESSVSEVDIGEILPETPTTAIEFSSTTIAALIIGAVLSFLIPIAAVTIFKLKNRDARLPSVFVGAITFIVFALVLEQLLHMIMLPIVQGNAVVYVIYGALAAGIFEETGRLVAYKVVMKDNLSVNNSVMMGLGHGGLEMMILLGFSLIGLAGSAIMVYNNGVESTINTLSQGNPDVVESVRQQLENIASYNFGIVALTIYERLIAMTFHVCMSVLVYHAVTQPGQIKLYVLAILLHAALDVPAAMYQVGLMPLGVVYIIMTIMTAAVVGFIIFMTKRFNDLYEN